MFNQPTSRERKDKSVKNYNEAEGLPVEVLPTEDVAVPEETFLVQLVPTVVTPDALHVPRLVQDRQQELGEDRLTAPVAAGEGHRGEPRAEKKTVCSKYINIVV